MSSPLTIWGDARLRTLLQRPRAEMPFPLDASTCTLYSRGRHALWNGVRQLALGSGDEVLVPAYHHGSEVEALIEAGIRCCFYDIGPDLAPDPAELETLIGARTRALLLVHYLGRPQAADEWRAWCDVHGLLLLEDAAQAWLSTLGGRAVGSFGDAAIFCLYKMIHAPDGAALVCTPTPAPARRSPLGVRQLVAERVRTRPAVQALRRLARRAARRRPTSTFDDFELGDAQSPIARISRALVARTAGPDVAEKRRANYRAMARELGEHMRPPFDTLPDGASPMVLPLTVEASEKADLLARLARAKIEAVESWAVPHPALPVERFPRSAALRRSVVGVPVHQGLTERDLDRIVGAVRHS